MNLIQYSDSLPADCRLRKDHIDALFASDCYHLVAWRWALFGPKSEPHSAGKARELTQIADAQLQVRLWFCQYREDHRTKDAVAATLRPHFSLAMRSLLPIFRSKLRTFRTHLDWSKTHQEKRENTEEQQTFEDSHCRSRACWQESVQLPLDVPRPAPFSAGWKPLTQNTQTKEKPPYK